MDLVNALAENEALKISNDQKMHIFVRGLIGQVKAHVELSKPIDFVSAVTKAKEVEQAFNIKPKNISKGSNSYIKGYNRNNKNYQNENNKKESSGKRFNGLCNHCKRKGHKEVDCWLLHGKPKEKLSSNKDQMEIDATELIDNYDDRPRLKAKVNDSTSYTALLDHGSMRSFIDEDLAKELNLKIEKTSISFKGINSKEFAINGISEVRLKFPSLAPSVKHKVKLFVGKMKHKLLLGYDIIKKIGLVVDPVKNEVSWRDYTCSIAGNNSKEIPLVNVESSFDILEVSNYSDNVIEEAVSKSHLVKEGNRMKLKEILMNYVNHIKDTPNGVKDYKFKNELTSEVPFQRTPPYPVPMAMYKKAKNLIDELVADGTIYRITDSSSIKCCSSGFFVWKPIPENGNLEERLLRLVVNFKFLNQFLKRGRVFMPKIDSLLEKVMKGMWFSSIDLTGSFHQLLLDLEFALYTAFVLPWGLYAYLKMPMGLSTSPEAFQEYMMNIFGFIEWLLIYIDDLLILSSSEEEGLVRLEVVLDTFIQNNIKVNIGKSLFLVRRVKYLGFILGPVGISPNPSKVDALMSMPVPKTLKDVRSQLGGLSFYRRFIPKMSTILAPLSDLIGKNVKFEITRKHIECLAEARELLAKCALLYYPDYSKPFHLQVDASDYGIGGHVYQIDNSGVVYPVYFFSRKFNKTQLKYTVVDKEALGMIASLQHLRTMLYGTDLTIYTDSLNLSYLKNSKSMKLLRYYHYIMEYKPEIVHISGKDNIWADYFSRMDFKDTAEEVAVLDDSFPFSMSLIGEKQRSDLSWNVAGNHFIDKTIEDCVVKVTQNLEQVAVPTSLVNSLLDWYHDVLVHPGFTRMYNALKQLFWWKSIRKDIEDFVKSCHVCQVNKTNKKNYGLLTATNIDENIGKFETVAIDIAGPYDIDTFYY